MFRMSFDQKVLETVEEQLFVYVYAYADLSLCTWLVSMCMKLIIMRTRAYSCVHISILEFLCMRFPTCIRVPSVCIHKHGLMCACR